MGGIGAGMICLEGTGAISHVSVRNKPDVYNEPMMFSALYVKGAKGARVLECVDGQVIARGPHAKGDPASDGSLYVPFKLKPRGEKVVCLLLCWYVPRGNIRVGADPEACGTASFLSSGCNGETCGPPTPPRCRRWAPGTRPRRSVSSGRKVPKYQYGGGCLSDGVLGDWIARCSGLTSARPQLLNNQRFKN